MDFIANTVAAVNEAKAYGASEVPFVATNQFLILLDHDFSDPSTPPLSVTYADAKAVLKQHSVGSLYSRIGNARRHAHTADGAWQQYESLPPTDLRRPALLEQVNKYTKLARDEYGKLLWGVARFEAIYAFPVLPDLPTVPDYVEPHI